MICFQPGLGVLFVTCQAQLSSFKQDALKPGVGAVRGVSTGSVTWLSSLCHMPPTPSFGFSSLRKYPTSVYSVCKSPLSTPQEHPPARAPGSPRSRGKQRPGSLWEVYLPRSRTCLAEHLRPLTPFPGAQLPPTLRQGWSPILKQGWRRPGALLSLHPQTPSSNLRRLPNPSDRPCWIRLQTKSDGLKMRTRGYS